MLNGDLLLITLMAIALGTDAFTVAVTCGMDGTVKTMGERIKIAVTFGFFQGFLFVVGMIVLQFIGGGMTRYNTFVAGIILIGLGIRSLFEGVQTSYIPSNPPARHFDLWMIILLGIATSIDALAAGITHGLISNQILTSTLLISGIAFIMTYVGAISGQRIGKLIGNKANIIGGIIIIILGLKSLFF